LNAGRTMLIVITKAAATAVKELRVTSKELEMVSGGLDRFIAYCSKKVFPKSILS
jgi:hypothetical protein